MPYGKATNPVLTCSQLKDALLTQSSSGVKLQMFLKITDFPFVVTG